MGCIRFRSLLLGLLLSFLALGDSIAGAHHAMEMIASNNQATSGDKVFLDETRTVAMTKNKLLRGRKMGAKEVEKKHVVEAKGPMNTGKARISTKKSWRASRRNTHDKDASSATSKSRPPVTVHMNSKGSSHGTVNPSSDQELLPGHVTSSTHGNFGLPPGERSSASHDGSHDPFHTTGVQKHQDAVTEMFNMLNKDYAAKARRKPPINNNTPLEDLDGEP